MLDVGIWSFLSPVHGKTQTRKTSAMMLTALVFWLTPSVIAASQTNVLMSITQPWRYLTNNLDATPQWTTAAYDDSSWAGPGNALLYIETATLPAPKNTPLPGTAGGTPMLTYYFRTTFVATNVSQIGFLVFSNLIDDGAVFYLNGTEIQRTRMDPGTVTYDTLANTFPGTGDATAFETFIIANDLLTNLIEGTNLLAAEAHQVGASSSDVVFGSSVTAITGFIATNTLISLGANWKYDDKGNDQGTAWRAPIFDDGSWSNGPAQLGYGDSDEATVLGYGPDPNNKYVTTYFRHSFQASAISNYTSLALRLIRDDGVVVYLNGTEIYRNNMPAGSPLYNTHASTSVGGADESTFYSTNPSPSLLVEGDNVLAAEIHQGETNSSDISFDLELTGTQVVGTAPPSQVIRGPYLQLSTPTSIVVRWRTDTSIASKVVYGTSLADLTFTNIDSAPTTEHQLTLTNLQPDTKYYYAVGTANALLTSPGSDYYFLTHPPIGSPKPLRIWAIGDAGTGSAGQTAVRNAFYNWNGTNVVHAWLQLGDNAYDSGLDTEYQAKVFNIYGQLFNHSVTWPTLGNHDTAQSTAYVDTYPYFQIFTLPTTGQAGGIPSGTEHYYSFDLGMVHFICLDSMTANRATNGAMANWLRADLAATTNRWVIAYWHHPPYTKGSHNSDTEPELVEMRENFNPILEAGGVDLALFGHSHSYERSFLLNGHYGIASTFNSNMIVQPGSGREVSSTGAYVKPENTFGAPIANQGAVYAVAGSSGQISGGTLNHPAMFISLNVLGSMVLDISSNRLDAKFLRETPVNNPLTNDWFTIRKENYPPVASNLTFVVAANATTNLALAGFDINRQPLKFATDSTAANGLVSGIAPVTGSFTFKPAHGFSGTNVFTYHVFDGRTNSAPGTVTIQVLAPADSNQNGLPDAWEAAYGVTDPNADDDNDGVSNLAEYWANTNPTDAASYLRLISIDTAQPGQVSITWQAVGGTRYRVSFADDLRNPFTDVVRPVTQEMHPGSYGTPASITFTDDFSLTGGPPAQGARFYRIRVVQ
jgi:hypothetical protein